MAAPTMDHGQFMQSPSSTTSTQSTLTPVPSELESTPEGLDCPTSNLSPNYQASSPICRRSKRARKPRIRIHESTSNSVHSNDGRLKRRKTATTASLAEASPHMGSLGSSDASPCETRHPLPETSSTSLPPSKCGGTSNLQPRHDLKWPGSALRSEIPLAQPVLTPNVPVSDVDQSIELDIREAFCAKLKQRRYKAANPPEKISKYINQFSPSHPFDDQSRKNQNTHCRFDAKSSNAQRSAASGTEIGSNNGSAAASPSEKVSKSNGAARNAKGHNKGGRFKGRNGGSGGNGGNGGRDRDSPDPHEKVSRTQEDQNLLKSIRQRQLELRKFYLIVGAQQMEALELMSSRDLSKIHKKPTAHTKVPEYDEILQDLEAKEQAAKNLAKRQYSMAVELAKQNLQSQEQIIEDSFRRRAREAKAEHVKGAEGDLIILQNAHTSQVDETRTDNCSDEMVNFPLYHEIPEPHARIRGYSSMRIDDEKPFKEHLASYDDQAQREVIGDDIVAPVMLSVAKQNAERAAEEEKEARQKLDQLVAISESELKHLAAYPVPRTQGMQTNPQFNLSRLADCADLVSQRERETAQIFMPVAPKEVPELGREYLDRIPRLAQEFRRPVALPPPISETMQNPRPKTPAVRKKKSGSMSARRLTKEEETQSQSSSSTSTPLPVIAPAPSKMPPPPASSQHHHHHLPQLSMPPPPSSLPVFGRHPTLAPLPIPKNQPPTPASQTHSQGPLSSHIPPPPSPFQSRPGPVSSTYQTPSSTIRGPPHYQMISHPPLQSTFPPQSVRRPSFEPPPPPPLQQSPTDPQTIQPQSQPRSQPPRFALNNTAASQTSRPLGQRRGSGQITFTPTQTPSSERFTRPPGPPPQLPGRSVIRPTQLGSGTTSTPNRLGSVMLNTTPDSRAQSAADIARQNAVKNQVQGAGPKGGRRVLLPKSH